MAKWHSSKPKQPIVSKFLYLQCDCADVQYRSDRIMTPEDFMKRLIGSRRVMIARPGDFPIVPEMSKDRDENCCVWRDEREALHFLTITREKDNRVHEVVATIDGGIQTEHICKHAISVARWLARKMWRAKHVFVCRRGDPEVERLIAWHKHLAGDSWEKPKWMWLDRDVCVIGWNFNSPNHTGSRLFEQKEN